MRGTGPDAKATLASFPDLGSVDELRRARSLLQSILESTADGLLVVDAQQEVVALNGRFGEIFDLPSELREGRSFPALLAHLASKVKEPEAFQRKVQNLGTRQEVESFDILELLDGRVIERSSIPQWMDGAAVGRVWSFRDVTDRHRAERERAQMFEREQEARAEAERANQAKDEFLATVSHELRTPLTPLMGWIQLLRAGKLDGAASRAAWERLEHSARLLTKLIDDLLDVSRIATGKLRLEMRPFELAPVVEAALDVVRPAARSKEVQIELQVEPGVGLVFGDPDRLQQVAWNLLANAVKFTSEGGQVRVRIERVGAHARLTVADNGHGIGPELLPLVFERFQQGAGVEVRRHGGFGIGLALVRHLVELHGGTVHAESAGLGHGAAFEVTLPIWAAPRPSAHEIAPQAREHGSAADQARSLSGLRVLVVDDDLDTTELLAAVLGAAGAEVVTAPTAMAALDALRARWPDVLIADIGLPDGDGYALMARVRALSAERGTRLPAVALTAYAGSEDRVRALHEGYDVHVAKPVEPSALVALVAQLAHRPSPESEPAR
jgi:PAS domain S-box-containing protein